MLHGKNRDSVTLYNFVNMTDLLLVWSAYSIILEAWLIVFLLACKQKGTGEEFYLEVSQASFLGFQGPSSGKESTCQ